MMALVIFLAVGSAGGFVLYEFLVRRYILPLGAKGVPYEGVFGKERSGRENLSHQKASGRTIFAMQTKSVHLVFSAAVERLERVLPMTRSDGETYRALLARAGWSIEPETWRGIRVLITVACAALVGFAITGTSKDPLFISGFVAIASVLAWAASRVVLGRAVALRRRMLEKQLPDAMELLSIAIAAGSPVEQCFREVAGSIDQPLAEEFAAVDREVNLLGHSRDQALSNLAKRCESRDVSAFVTQLALAINQGASISESLSAQAALARHTAQTALLERIRKMPTKLDMVLSFCFLPPTIALVVVPTVVDLLKFLNDTLK